MRALEASRPPFELSRDMICIAGFDGYFKSGQPGLRARPSATARRSCSAVPSSSSSTPTIASDTVDGGRRRSPTAIGTVEFQNRYLDKDGRGALAGVDLGGVFPSEDLIYAVARDVTERKVLEHGARSCSPSATR